MKLYSLQYLRAIAALAVVYSHSVFQVNDFEPHLRHTGAFGVDIFFVISGFIMVYISKSRDTMKSFISNRIRRVVPLYWFFTLLMGFLLLVNPELFRNTLFDWQVLVKSLFFVPHYSTAYPDQLWPLVAPGWSLNYEMYFYALFALSLIVPMKGRFFFMTAVITGTLLVTRQMTDENSWIVFFRNPIVLEFLFGMALAYVYRLGFTVNPMLAYAFVISGFFILFLELPYPPLVATGIPAFIIVIGTVYSKLPNWKFFTVLGDASYALYLSHIFTLGVCRKIFPPFLGDDLTAAWIFVVLSLILCTLVSIVVHFLIDEWLLRKQRFQFLSSRLRKS